MIFTDQQIAGLAEFHEGDVETDLEWNLVSTLLLLIGRVSAAEQVCLNVGQFFELPDEERKSRLKGSLDRWRRARNG